MGSSSSYSLGATGGASTVQLAVANLPNHTHSASQSAHTHSQPTHRHSFYGIKNNGSNIVGDGNYTVPYYTGTKYSSASDTLSLSGGDTTGSSAPSISIGSTGSGTAFSIMPPYLVINIWKRLS